MQRSLSAMSHFCFSNVIGRVVCLKGENELEHSTRAPLMIYCCTTEKVPKGEINGALGLIQEKGKGGVLPITSEVHQSLAEKHPPAEPPLWSCLLSGR